MGATKRQAEQRKSKQTKPEEKPWVLIKHNLTSEDKKVLSEMDYETEFPHSMLFDLPDERYKVSMTFNETNNSYIVSMTDLDPESEWYRHTLTGYGASAYKAFVSLMFRHHVLAIDNEWGYLKVSKDRPTEDFS